MQASVPYMTSTTCYFSEKQCKLTDYEWITPPKCFSINNG